MPKTTLHYQGQRANQSMAPYSHSRQAPQSNAAGLLSSGQQASEEHKENEAERPTPSFRIERVAQEDKVLPGISPVKPDHVPGHEQEQRCGSGQPVPLAPRTARGLGSRQARMHLVLVHAPYTLNPKP